MPSRCLATSPRNPDRRRYALYMVPVGGALLWHAAVVCGLLSRHTLDAPSASLASAWTLVSGALAHHNLMALLRIAVGLATGLLTGTAVAFLSKPGDNLVRMPLQMLRPLPFLALAPLLVLLSGMPHAPSIALIALSTACPSYFAMFSAIRGAAGPVCGAPVNWAAHHLGSRAARFHGHATALHRPRSPAKPRDPAARAASD